MLGRSSINVVWIGVFFLVLSSVACAPLPKESTRKMADEIGKLSNSYGILSKFASQSDHTEEWTEQMLRSGVALDPTLGNCSQGIGDTENKIYERLQEILHSERPPQPSSTVIVTIDWEGFATDLGKNVEKCRLIPLSKTRPFGWNPNGSKVEVLGVPTDTPLKDYVLVIDLMVQSLANYYTAIANAADDKDIVAEEVKLKEINSAVGGLVGTASSFASGPAGPAFGALTTAVLNLAVELRGARLRSQRYDAIEKALVDVDDHTVELFEDLIGTTVVLLQAYQTETLIRGSINNGISDFNVTPPRDRLASRLQLERAIERYRTVRSALNTDLVKGLTAIGEAHKELRKAVVAREGTFDNTFAQLLKLTEGVNAIRNAFKQLEEAQKKEGA